MDKKTHPAPVNQTAIGNDNIQIVGNNNFITRITNFFAGDTDAQRTQRNRCAMLELVKNTWIKGVLEKSLYNEVLIDLDLEERPGEVDHPWAMQMQMPHQPNRTLLPGTALINIFDELSGAMLILGEPGSGKTTMLLDLARACIARAEQDDTQPVPVVLNLSSWVDPEQNIDDWLVDELISKYFVPKEIARNWVVKNDLLLLFDGLDEVKPKDQKACVKAINDFHQNHGLTMPIVVCCRVADYEMLTVKLSLQGAVLLRPLSTEKIKWYFEQGESELRGAYQILKKDKILQEILKQPLMLSLLNLAYRDTSRERLIGKEFGSVESWRKHLFDLYVQQMFERVARTKNQLYTPEQTRHWLSWLAKRTIVQTQSFFQIEQIQPDWLKPGAEVKWYGIVSRVVVGLIVGIMLAAFVGQQSWLLGGVIVGSVYGVIAGLGFRNATSASTTSNNTLRRDILAILLTVILGGLYAAGSFAFHFSQYPGYPIIHLAILNGIVDGIFYGLVGGIFYKIVNGARTGKNDIETVEALKWSWKSFLQGILSGVGVGIVIGAVFGVILGAIFLIYGKFIDPQYGYGFIDGLKTGTRLGLFIGPTFGIGFRLRKKLISQEVKEKTSPNQGIWMSLRNGALIGLTITVFNTVIFGVYAGINNFIIQASRTFIPSFTIGSVFLWGITSGVIVFLFFGGYTVIQHLILRFILWRDDAIPLNLVRLLDYASERILLRKVGGGYIFVHRLLMEYFAALNPENK
jgi:eukaryotic-like serine/threonine-protein kinase